MAEVTKRKFLNFLSFFTSLLVAWLTGASSTARESGQDLKSPVESGSWHYSGTSLNTGTGPLLPVAGSPGLTSAGDTHLDTAAPLVQVAAYGGESPGARFGSGKDPIKPGQIRTRQPGENTTPRRERAILERFLNNRERVRNNARRCETKIKRGESAFKCISEVVSDLEIRLVREANRGSSVARAALPIVREMKVEIRDAKSTEEAIAAMRRGIGKVQRISLVRSQDTVIVNLQQQQRTVLAESLQAVEVSLAKAASI